MPGVGVEPSRVLKARMLFILRDARKTKSAELRYTGGTRARRIFESVVILLVGEKAGKLRASLFATIEDWTIAELCILN